MKPGSLDNGEQVMSLSYKAFDQSKEILESVISSNTSNHWKTLPSKLSPIHPHPQIDFTLPCLIFAQFVIAIC